MGKPSTTLHVFQKISFGFNIKNVNIIRATTNYRNLNLIGTGYGYLRNMVTPVACKSLAMPFQDLMIWYLSRVVREQRVSITDTLRIHFRCGDRLMHGLEVFEILFRISMGTFFSTGVVG